MKKMLPVAGSDFTLCLLAVTVLAIFNQKSQSAIDTRLRESRVRENPGDSNRSLSKHKKRIKGLVKRDRPD